MLVLIDERHRAFDIALDLLAVRKDDNSLAEPDVLLPENLGRELVDPGKQIRALGKPGLLDLLVFVGPRILDRDFDFLAGLAARLLGQFDHQLRHFADDLAANVLREFGLENIVVRREGFPFLPHQQQHLGVFVGRVHVEVVQLGRGTLGIFLEKRMIDALRLGVAAPREITIGHGQLHGPHALAVLVGFRCNDRLGFVPLADGNQALKLDDLNNDFHAGVPTFQAVKDLHGEIGQAPGLQCAGVVQFHPQLGINPRLHELLGEKTRRAEHGCQKQDRQSDPKGAGAIQLCAFHGASYIYVGRMAGQTFLWPPHTFTPPYC